MRKLEGSVCMCVGTRYMFLQCFVIATGVEVLVRNIKGLPHNTGLREIVTTNPNIACRLFILIKCYLLRNCMSLSLRSVTSYNIKS